MRKIVALAFFLVFFISLIAQNSALEFDGTDDYVATPSQLVPVSGNFTVDLWVLFLKDGKGRAKRILKL